MGQESSQLAPPNKPQLNMPSASHPWSNSFSKSKSAATPIPPIQSMAKSMTSTMNQPAHGSVGKYIKTDVQNGVIGEHVSLAIAETVYIFWHKNIDRLPREEQLEIGCSIYFTMMGSSEDMKHILWNRGNSNGQRNIKSLAHSLLDMMGWVIRSLITSNINLKATLAQLGIAHRALGIQPSHFAAMLVAVHETFAYYFEHKYSIKERYAFGKLFTVAAELMTGGDIYTHSHIFDDLKFLNSLSECLACDVGREYLYRYFQQTFCDELVIYLQSIRRYKAASCDKERFIIARDICKTSVKPTAAFPINISYETRVRTLGHMRQLEAQFFNPIKTEEFEVAITMFDACQKEIVKLIELNHWKAFTTKITMLKNIS
eukprot:219408_1